MAGTAHNLTASPAPAGSTRWLLGAPTTPPPPGGKSLLTRSDLTYLGAYRVPRGAITNYDGLYGDGLALRRESADTTNPVHLLSASYGNAPNQMVYEWRDATPSTTFGTTLASYPLATVMKTYGDVYSGKKLRLNGGVEQPLVGSTDGRYGMYWDETDGRLYWCYGDTYSNDYNTWCFGYSTLDYAANTGTGFGPWRLWNSGNGQGYKSIITGLAGVPAAYAASHLSGRRLAMGFGGYGSLVGSGDSSLGPSLTAIDPPANGATEKTDLPSTPIFGYWPFADTPGAGKGRANRPESRTAVNYTVDSWPVDKYSWRDSVPAGAWVDTASRYGVIFAGEYGRGVTQYVDSTIPVSYFGHYFAIYDPNQFTPASGTPRYDVQPADIWTYQYPTIDYAGEDYYNNSTLKSVSSITSVAGSSRGTYANCTVNCAGHNLSGVLYCEIQGASVTEYNGLWSIQTVDANSFHIKNGNVSGTWSGTSPSGTITARRVVNYRDRVMGMAFDGVSGKLYVMLAIDPSTQGGQLMVHVYQVPT